MITIFDGLNHIRLQLEAGRSSLGTIFRSYACVPENHPTIWVWEGKGGNNRRRSLYPGYKAQRVGPSEDMFKAIGVFQGLMKNFSNTYQISVPGYEGDDIIYSLAQHYQQTDDVFIQSTDKDLRAFFNNRVNGAPTRLTGYQKEEIPDNLVRLYKTLVGDASDCIKGIPSFGAKAFHDCDKEAIMEKFTCGIFRLGEEDGLSLKHALWTQVPENTALLKTMWEIVGFYPVDVSELAKHMTRGTYNPEGAHRILKEYFME